ncbi:hypothetical protein V6O07_11605 [Arthrospira platensis SPKY2]
MAKFTQEEINKLVSNIKQIAEQKGFDRQEDLFEIIQPYRNGQSISLKVEENEEGKKVIKINVFNSTYILPEIDADLDIFN